MGMVASTKRPSIRLPAPVETALTQGWGPTCQHSNMAASLQKTDHDTSDCSTHAFVCVSTYIRIYIYICIYTYSTVYTLLYAYVTLYMYSILLYAHIHIGIRVCACVYIYIYICLYRYIENVGVCALLPSASKCHLWFCRYQDALAST